MKSAVMSRGTTACETTRIVEDRASFIGSMGIENHLQPAARFSWSHSSRQSSTSRDGDWVLRGVRGDRARGGGESGGQGKTCGISRQPAAKQRVLRGHKAGTATTTTGFSGVEHYVHSPRNRRETAVFLFILDQAARMLQRFHSFPRPLEAFVSSQRTT